MPTFSAPDGTALAYHRSGDGDGPPLVCLPGGPMRDSAYFGDLGGLAAHRRVITLDLRGTGQSEIPSDPATYRCDRLVDDVEALRAHLGLGTMHLLGHSAGGNLAALYAARHPEHVGRLALITPGTEAVGIAIGPEDRLEVAKSREGEPWFAEAFAGLQEIVTGRGTQESWRAVAPFKYGRWDEAARALEAAGEKQRNDEAGAVFGAPDAFDPGATRRALSVFASPVLLLAGEVDLATPPSRLAEFAEMFPDARLVVQPGAGHFPWLDDGDWFAAALTAFLG
ncbi:alpha/beta fold hydrolase [Streptomyces sp. 6N223]|uniref:alpha/beta fold hydrolase n=1 Tax=Streptomyces sp. 6N223 TaxID=3457412 RepID=UPI003FCFB268